MGHGGLLPSRLPVEGKFLGFIWNPLSWVMEAAAINGYRARQRRESKFLNFLGFMWNPLSLVMQADAIMAIALANRGVNCLQITCI